MKHLTGTFKHYCHDWDGMAIDETCPEFLSCTCHWRSDIEDRLAHERKTQLEVQLDRSIGG